MSYKGAIQIAVCVLLSVWVVCGFFIYAADKQRDAEEISYQNAASSIFADVTETTAQSVTSTSENAALNADENLVVTTVATPTQVTTTAVIAEAETTTESTDSAVPSTTSEIISAYVNAVNALKSEQNFSLIKTDSLDITIDDMTGATVLSGIANSVIASNTPSGAYYFTFVNGVDSSGSTPNSVIAPLNTSAALSESGVISASATETATGGYVITIYLIDELQTLSTPALYHSTTVEVVNLDVVGVPSGADIETLDITYSGTMIQAELNSDGKIVSMYHELPVDDAYCSGSYLLISAFAQIHGLYTSSYQIAY